MLVQLLLHEVAVGAAPDGSAGQPRLADGAFHDAARPVHEAGAAAADGGPVAVLQIGDAARERRQGQGVGAEEHLVVAEADRERRAVAGADHQIREAREDQGERIGALQPLEAGGGGLLRRHAALEIEVEQLSHALGVGLGRELLAFRLQLGAEGDVVLDDAVVDDGDAGRTVGMGIALGGRAMGRPAGMADARRAGEGPALEHGGEIAELALGAAAIDAGAVERGDAGAVIAAIFEAAERFEDERSRRACAQDADDTAHRNSILHQTKVFASFPKRKRCSFFAKKNQKTLIHDACAIWTGWQPRRPASPPDGRGRRRAHPRRHPP
jgi:hypothetical protein